MTFEEKETRDEPVGSLNSIEMELQGKDTVMVSGYDDDGKYWKEFYRHDHSVGRKLDDEAEE